jgi:hypothetical protein
MTAALSKTWFWAYSFLIDTRLGIQSLPPSAASVNTAKAAPGAGAWLQATVSRNAM